MKYCYVFLICLLLITCSRKIDHQVETDPASLAGIKTSQEGSPVSVNPAAKIYYLQSYPGDIYKVNPDGSGTLRLTSDGKNGNFDLNAAGTLIVYGNMAKNNWNIYLADVTGTGLTNKRVIYNGKYRDEDCRLTPDGKKIVFKTNQFGATIFGNSAAYDIVVLDIATGVLTQLTHNSNKEAWAPCISVDGGKVAFVLRDNAIGGSSDEIYTVNIDGSNLKQITSNSYQDWYPSFSNEGNLIYISKKIASCDDDLYQIPASALSTTDPESQSQILNVNACNFVSDADPYGSRANENNLVFVSTRGGRFAVYAADKNTGAVTLIAQKSNADLLGPVLIE